ncbi:MAG TPA: prolyl oligopeptidase family serine peptidase, partial [Ideonella sp.]|nr:prolyl oligopeptidase family serine peptidase [Ideonella sp.]
DVAKWRARFGDKVKEASPLQHPGPGLPPTLILHGKADTTAPYADVERFCAAARAQKEDCQVVGYDRASHGFFNQRNGPMDWYSDTLKQADQFLTRLGYLPPAAPPASR